MKEKSHFKYKYDNIEIPLNAEDEDKCSCKYEDYKFIFKPSNINDFVKTLSKKFITNSRLDTFDIEYKILNQINNHPSIRKRLYCPTYLENRKNRYTDIYMVDNYRVKLPLLVDDPASSFINATYLYNILPNSKNYIAAAAPLPNSFREWWRMIYDNNVCMIVMLTKLAEKIKKYPNVCKKADKYWPEYIKNNDGSILDKDVSTDPYLLKNSNNTINYLTVKRLSPTNKNIELKDMNLTKNELEQIEIFIVNMYDSSLIELGSRKVIFIWNQSLPDNHAPIKNKSCDQFIQYKNFVILFNRLYNKYNNNKKPVVVHCSAGIGRTGFFVTIDMILDNISNSYLEKIKKRISEKNDQLQQINLLKKKRLTYLPAISVFEVVKCLRTRRPMMVSNKAQYVFIHLFIAYCLKKVEI